MTYQHNSVLVLLGYKTYWLMSSVACDRETDRRCHFYRRAGDHRGHSATEDSTTCLASEATTCSAGNDPRPQQHCPASSAYSKYTILISDHVISFYKASSVD